MKTDKGTQMKEDSIPLPSGGDKGEGIVRRNLSNIMIWKKKPPYSGYLSKNVRQLRNNSTPAERKLWEVLKEMRPATGLKFRRQYPIGSYIADFYCHAYKCVIEIDGSSHDGKIEKDRLRDTYMVERGIRVLRYTEQETQSDPYAVAETIVTVLKSALPKPLPSGGV